MGSMITLGIGRMEIDWGKNNVFTDHSPLFKTSDIKQIPYYYVDNDGNPIIEMKEGYSRKLSQLNRRLDLLGYSMTKIRDIFEETKKSFEEYGRKINISFDEYYEVIKNIDISQIDTVKFASEYDECGYDLGEYARRCVLVSPQLRDRLVVEYYEDDDDFTFKNPEYDISEFLENIDPYITLRILCENPKNFDQEVQWSFADVVENGWTSKEEIVKELPPEKRILIVTEGTSDSYIIKHTIDELYPDISDFFDFIDMNENYPFTGTGSLYNFCVGLCRINIQNNIIVIFDNDTAGLEKYNQSQLLVKPKSFLITKLPDCEEFKNFNTIGPQGKSLEDINGRAVAIECFLDFDSIGKIPYVRWTSYNKNADKYQGELVNKDAYVRSLKKNNLTDGIYNIQKLKYLIDYIIKEWLDR